MIKVAKIATFSGLLVLPLTKPLNSKGTMHVQACTSYVVALARVGLGTCIFIIIFLFARAQRLMSLTQRTVSYWTDSTKLPSHSLP